MPTLYLYVVSDVPLKQDHVSVLGASMGRFKTLVEKVSTKGSKLQSSHKRRHKKTAQDKERGNVWRCKPARQRTTIAA